MSVRASLAVALVCGAGLAGAPAALASTTKSTNWAGYAVHRSGISFRQVSATWTQPTVTCVNGQKSYSAVWVGLGGYSATSNALEQVGTEVDCTSSGRLVSNAWYELVPARSNTLSLSVNPGDVIHATVVVNGQQVVVKLENVTRHSTFQRILRASTTDVSSAEWIVEAPSGCVSQFVCQSLPLADFGSVSFKSAMVRTGRGASGSILAHGWSRTKIELAPEPQRFAAARHTTQGTATPSSLRGGGTAFDVTYATASVPGGQQFAQRSAAVPAAQVQH